MKLKKDRIRVALQKSGRLTENSLEYLSEYGFSESPCSGELFYESKKSPFDLLFVRDDDIPNLVQEGVCDYGIVGANVVRESGCALKIRRKLNFGLCRLSLAMPENFQFRNIRSLNGLKIATSYPNLLRQFAIKNNLEINITTLNGSVEIAPRLGLADGICDLVSSGATLRANQLKEVKIILQSQAVLIEGVSK